MTNEQFKIELENSINRSKLTLIKKEKEYSNGRDRLEQFHRAGAAQAISPTEALVGMATKHFTSMADMAKDSNSFSIKEWNERIGDLRNYTFLLDALVRDLRDE
jgi:hypothetical protein